MLLCRIVSWRPKLPVVILGILALAAIVVGALAAGGAFSRRSSTASTTTTSSATGSATTSSPRSTTTQSPAQQALIPTPVSATESFYHLAASHRYAAAWALADSTLRRQLAGYGNFKTLMSPVQSITFDSAQVVSQSSDAATVAIVTAAGHTDGTQHCGGTVDLMRGANSGWVLHTIRINCT